MGERKNGGRKMVGDKKMAGDEAVGDKMAGDQVTIDVDVNGFLNYASWQNSVPLVQSLLIRNPTNQVLHGLRLTVQSSPKFIRPKAWVIDRMAAGGELPIRDRDLSLDADYLNTLNEAERGVLTFNLQHGEETIASCEKEVRVLARDEWPGMNSGGELLAAFVMPNDPAIAGLLKIAGEVLAREGHRSALDGYQSGDPARAYGPSHKKCPIGVAWKLLGMIFSRHERWNASYRNGS